MKNISISLNKHFQEFIINQVKTGNYDSVSDVISAALHLLEESEIKAQRLGIEIQKGLDSGTITGEQHHNRFAKKRLSALEARGIS